MADRDPAQDNLFKEIDEELRHEHYAVLWKKYGNYVIGAAVVLVLAVGGYQGWKAYDLHQRTEASATFDIALRATGENKPDEAAAALKVLADSGADGYALLARFNQAALTAKDDTRAGADAYFDIAGDSGVDEIWQGLATIQGVRLILDSGDTNDLSARLTPLMSGNGPWRHSAKELAAVLANRSGDAERAGKLFRELADDATAPQGIRARAAEMNAVLGG